MGRELICSNWICQPPNRARQIEFLSKEHLKRILDWAEQILIKPFPLSHCGGAVTLKLESLPLPTIRPFRSYHKQMFTREIESSGEILRMRKSL